MELARYPGAEKLNFIKNLLPMYTDNLSYILRVWAEEYNTTADKLEKTADGKTFLFDTENPVAPNQDYEYNEKAEVIKEAGAFHELRRNTIIQLITAVLTEEFNEHNEYANIVGATYHFALPDIARDAWNNTIDDISVLAFFQGMPMGADSYYNNYSLGGSRIVQTTYLYAETVLDGAGVKHRVYHKAYCPLLPRDEYGNILYSDGSGAINKTYIAPDGTVRHTTGIEQIFVNSSHIRELEEAERYYICSECM